MDTISVEIGINDDIERIWNFVTDSMHIRNWYFASDEWKVNNVENNFVLNGKIVSLTAQ